MCQPKATKPPGRFPGGTSEGELKKTEQRTIVLILKCEHGKSHGGDFHHFYCTEVTWNDLERPHKEVLSQVSRSRASKDCNLL